MNRLSTTSEDRTEAAQSLAEHSVRQLCRSPHGTIAAVALRKFIVDCNNLDFHNQRALLDLLQLFFDGYTGTVGDTLEDRIPRQPKV